jgi:hypothetical protein
MKEVDIMLNIKNAVKGLLVGCVVMVGCLVSGQSAKADVVKDINTSIVNVENTGSNEIDTIEVNGNTYRFYGYGWHVGDLCTVAMDNDKVVNSKPYINDWLYNKITNEPTMVKLDDLINNGTIQINYNNYADVLKNILYRDNNKVMTHYTQDGSWYVINEYNGTYGCHNSVNGDEQWFKGQDDLIQYMKDNWSGTGKMNR